MMISGGNRNPTNAERARRCTTRSPTRRAMRSRSSMSDLFIGKVRVAQRGDAGLIGSVAEQLPAQLGARRLLATRQHERRVAEIDERERANG